MDNTANADLIRKYWPEWHIVKQLGHGSFGDVYDCEKADGVTEPTQFGLDQQLSPGGMAVKHSAVKVIAIPQYDSQIAMMRAEGIPPEEIGPYYKKIAEDCVKEIKTMESLKSCPNVVYIEDFKVARKEDGEGWVILIRMELLTGLPDYMQAHAMNEADILRLGIDICTALKVCHAKSIIHRDIKPGNIMVNEFGVFKLADFGIARELDKSEMGMSKKGTYSYMAPEMEMMDTYDHRVDLYALGIVLYQLLNRNRAPFLDPLAPSVSYEDKQRASMRRIMGESFPPPLNGSEATKQAVMKACAYQTKDRFASADEMQLALQQALTRLNAAPTDDAPTEIGQPAHTPRQDGDETAFAAKPPQPERNNRPSRQRDADATAIAAGRRADRNSAPQPEGEKTVFNQQGRNRQTPAVSNSAPQAAPEVNNAAHPTPQAQPADKRKKTFVLLIAVLAVVIIAAVGFAISRLPHQSNINSGTEQNDGTMNNTDIEQTDNNTTDNTENEIQNQTGTKDTPIVLTSLPNPAIETMPNSERKYLIVLNIYHRMIESYEPEIIKISEDSDIYLDKQVAEAYLEMAQAAAQDGVILTLDSGYISIEKQKRMFQKQVENYTSQGMDKDEAEIKAAYEVLPPGCSEANYGLSVDFSWTGDDFTTTDTYVWLQTHAAEYGFTERYIAGKENITHVKANPAHWRYVGPDISVYLRDYNISLEEYVQ